MEWNKNGVVRYNTNCFNIVKYNWYNILNKKFFKKPCNYTINRIL